MTSSLPTSEPFDRGRVDFAIAYVRYELNDDLLAGVVSAAETIASNADAPSSVGRLAALSRMVDGRSVRSEVEVAAVDLGLPSRADTNWREQFANLALRGFLLDLLSPGECAELITALFDNFTAGAPDGFSTFVSMVYVLRERNADRESVVGDLKELARLLLGEEVTGL